MHVQSELRYDKLGLRIKEIRKQKGLTQEQLAEIVGCNTSHISNIENNHTKVSLNVLLTIANALDTTIDYLIGNQYNDYSSVLDKEALRILNTFDNEKKERICKILPFL